MNIYQTHSFVIHYKNVIKNFKFYFVLFLNVDTLIINMNKEKNEDERYNISFYIRTI